jgi:hypothetical protein
MCAAGRAAWRRGRPRLRRQPRRRGELRSSPRGQSCTRPRDCACAVGPPARVEESDARRARSRRQSHRPRVRAEQTDLVPSELERPRARLPVDVDRRQREQLGETLQSRPDDVQVVVERGCIDVHVHDGHLTAVLAEGDETRRGSCSSTNAASSRDRALELRERTGSYVRRVDVDQWLRHVISQTSSVSIRDPSAARVRLPPLHTTMRRARHARAATRSKRTRPSSGCCNASAPTSRRSDACT